MIRHREAGHHGLVGQPGGTKRSGLRIMAMQRPWTKAEDEEVLAMRTGGIKWHVVAKRLGRTEASTVSHGLKVLKRARATKASEPAEQRRARVDTQTAP